DRIAPSLDEKFESLDTAHGDALGERHRREVVARYIVLQQDVADQRAVAVQRDDVVAGRGEVREARARRLNPLPLVKDVRRFAGRQERVATDRHDELRQPTPSKEGRSILASL